MPWSGDGRTNVALTTERIKKRKRYTRFGILARLLWRPTAPSVLAFHELDVQAYRALVFAASLGLNGALARVTRGLTRRCARDRLLALPFGKAHGSTERDLIDPIAGIAALVHVLATWY